VGTYLKIASVVSAVFVLIVSFLILPNDTWDNATIFGVILLASSVALSLWAPAGLLAWGKTEVGTIASVGISGSVLLIYTFLSLLTVFLGAVGIERKYVWATGLIAVSWVIIGLLISKESIGHLDKSFTDYSPAKDSLKEIRNQIELIQAKSKPEFYDDIAGVVENLKYSASDLSDISVQNNDIILHIINEELRPAIEVENINAIKAACVKINQEIDGRNRLILSNRTKI
jgi:hypothetical protein